MTTAETAEHEVRERVARFLQAYEQRDLATMSQLFARDNAFLFYGTQSNLHFVGWPALEASFRRQFEVLSSIRIGLDPATLFVRILAQGGAACIATESMHYEAMIGERVLKFPRLRVTGTLERHKDCWLFVQMHWSLSDREILIQHEGGLK